jgi:hypothetical protein
MTTIDIRPLDHEQFEVTIDEGSTSSMHVVTATEKQVSLLCEDCDPEHVVEASIRFLLDREPKESIMNQFDLDVIARFFPDYGSKIDDYL